MKYFMLVLGTSDEFFDEPVLLMSSDVNANGGRGSTLFTRRISNAKVFDGIDKVMECWREQSTFAPIRPDGKPNRPMSCFTIQPVPVAEIDRHFNIHNEGTA